MDKVAIVTDSIACITKEHAERYNIVVVPVNILFDGTLYKDWVDLSPDKAYEFLDRSPKAWKSSAASPEEYLTIYRELSRSAQNILTVTISSKISMFYDSALIAREAIKEESPQTKIEILDSETVTAAEGFIALAAAQAADKGKPLDAVTDIAKRVKERVQFFALLETIKYVYRTGRIPRIASQIGSTIPVKPILTASNGLIRFSSAARTRAKGIEKILHTMSNNIGNMASVHVAVMHADNPEEAERVKERVAAEFNCAELFITHFSPVMGYATGRGTLALAYYKSLDYPQ